MIDLKYRGMRAMDTFHFWNDRRLKFSEEHQLIIDDEEKGKAKK